jgi:hypothetical protein
MPWWCIGDWRYSFSIPKPGSGWKWVVSLTRLSFLLPGKVPVVSEGYCQLSMDCAVKWRTISWSCRVQNDRPALRPSLYILNCPDSVLCSHKQEILICVNKDFDFFVKIGVFRCEWKIIYTECQAAFLFKFSAEIQTSAGGWLVQDGEWAPMQRGRRCNNVTGDWAHP